VFLGLDSAQQLSAETAARTGPIMLLLVTQTKLDGQQKQCHIMLACKHSQQHNTELDGPWGGQLNPGCSPSGLNLLNPAHLYISVPLSLNSSCRMVFTMRSVLVPYNIVPQNNTEHTTLYCENPRISWATLGFRRHPCSAGGMLNPAHL
jgi:hypothetical protein